MATKKKRDSKRIKKEPQKPSKGGVWIAFSTIGILIIALLVTLNKESSINFVCAATPIRTICVCDVFTAPNSSGSPPGNITFMLPKCEKWRFKNECEKGNEDYLTVLNTSGGFYKEYDWNRAIRNFEVDKRYNIRNKICREITKEERTERYCYEHPYNSTICSCVSWKSTCQYNPLNGSDICLGEPGSVECEDAVPKTPCEMDDPKWIGESKEVINPDYLTNCCEPITSGSSKEVNINNQTYTIGISIPKDFDWKGNIICFDGNENFGKINSVDMKLCSRTPKTINKIFCREKSPCEKGLIGWYNEPRYDIECYAPGLSPISGVNVSQQDINNLLTANYTCNFQKNYSYCTEWDTNITLSIQPTNQWNSSDSTNPASLCPSGTKFKEVTCDCARNTRSPCMAMCFECLNLSDIPDILYPELS